MSKETSKSARPVKATPKSKVKGSAQQIWQVGLGALSKAQAEGAKALETLVKDSVSIQRKTKAVAEERLSDATSKVSSMATDLTSRATGQWDKLENIFEERVAKALNKLGVPSAKDVVALIARIDELNKTVQQLSQQNAVAKPAAKPAVKARAESAPSTAKVKPAASRGGKANKP